MRSSFVILAALLNHEILCRAISPILPGLWADPNIAVFGQEYYLFPTEDGFPDWSGQQFYVWKSSDLVNWTRGTDAILTLNGTSGNVPWSDGSAWAPTIAEKNGTYYFYFSGNNPTYNRKTIGVAIADNPEGPYTAQPTAFITNIESIHANQAIDPYAFHEPPSSVAYRKGLHHFNYAINDTRSEYYATGYATSTNLTGPYTYQYPILQLNATLGILGTGGSTLLNVPRTDDWYIAYHRFQIPDGNGTLRETTIDRLYFNSETGLIEKVVPTLESVSAEIVP
ncbi:hypothetical protein DID88_000956 [Monilinia fructigena]|uniref:Uncharacterized protein n=1 Tax=Monilinia fructigena TaxID=38457 RepID=A0A395IZZ7_9HELO|nr:hypothetical protein DID88_000956 [Monilinia fructigena]